MGIYPLMDDLTVRWGCTDLDNGEADLEAANDIATMLRAAGLNAWVERSRSKGFHVWTFANEPVPAATMRNALLAVHQILEIPAKEVNPKQVSLDGTAKGLGNYVRLPYPGALAMHTAYNERQVMIGIGLPEFVKCALPRRNSAADYERLAQAYIPPPPPKLVDIGEEPTLDRTLTARLSKPAYLAWRYGPTEGHDRSSSMFRLACMCQEDGLTAGEALTIVRDLDNRLLHKFTDRPDGEEQLRKMITRAYG